MSKAREAAIFASQAPKRKNLIINGCFRVGQRAITLISHASNEFCLDRWKYVSNSTAVVNTSQSVDPADASVPFVTSYVMSPTAADTVIDAGVYSGIVYKVEGLDCQHLRMGTSGAETLTLSFWHNHTLTGTHSGSIRNNAINRSYVFEYTQSVSNTWEKAEITFTLDTTGTWLLDNSAGIVLHFAYAVGSGFTGSVGSWQAGNALGSTNQVNNLGNAINRVEFAQVQLEVGDEATDFEARSFGEELALCQRYFEKSSSQDVYFGNLAANGSAYGRAAITGTFWPAMSVYFRVSKAGTPDISIWAPGSGTTNKIRNITLSTDLTPSVLYQNENSFSARSSDSVSASNECSFNWYAEAEL